ncbi:MAG: hypothetical protein ABJH33_10185 [Rhizobiaceae bacterium]
MMDNLGGVLDVMLGRASGLSRMDLSANGVIWSFAGLAIAGLIDLSALSMLYENLLEAKRAEVGKITYMIGRLFIALVAYGASMFALYLLCRQPHEQANFPTAIAVHNWASPIISLAFLPFLYVAVVRGGTSDLANLISVFWIGLLIFIGIRLIRISLDLPIGKGAAFFVVTALITLIISKGLESLFGLTHQVST